MSRNRMRKFEILGVELVPGGSGPERSWRIRFRAIINKQWVEQEMWAIARTEAEARSKMEQRFGGVE